MKFKNLFLGRQPLNLIFAVIMAISAMSTGVEAAGEMELKIFHRLYGGGETLAGGQCDKAPGACRLDVCARPLTAAGGDTPSDSAKFCALGAAATSFVSQRGSGGTAAASGEAALRLQFDGPWEGTFALDVRIIDNATQKVLAQLSVEQTEFLAAARRDWTQIDTAKPVGLPAGRLELSLRLRVNCAANYYGRRCAVRCEPTARFDCAAETGARRCRAGWRGADCQTSEEKCAGVECANGNCNPETGECVCRDGYRGAKCDQCVTWAECKGRCTRPYECLCPAGRGGPNCDKDMMYCAHNAPCLNGGICSNDGNGSYACQCTPGFLGRDCQHRIESCEDAPCRNGAACIAGFVCRCPAGAHGRYCQSTARRCADQPCTNNASCFEPPPVARWRGGVQILPPATGAQTSFECRCPRGWAGALCDTPAGWCAPDKCFNGGSCMESANSALGFACRCTPGFTGTRCEWNINDCKDQPCQNNGTCVDAIGGFRCECRAGFTGPMCQLVDEAYAALLATARNESAALTAGGKSATIVGPTPVAVNAKFIVGSLLFISAVLLLLVACVWHLRVHLATKIQQQQQHDQRQNDNCVDVAMALDVDALARQKRRLDIIGTMADKIGDKTERHTVESTRRGDKPCGRCHVVPPPSYDETFAGANPTSSYALYPSSLSQDAQEATTSVENQNTDSISASSHTRNGNLSRELRQMSPQSPDGPVVLEDFETLVPLQFQPYQPTTRLTSALTGDSIIVDLDEGFASDGCNQLHNSRTPNDRRPDRPWPSPSSMSVWSSGS